MEAVEAHAVVRRVSLDEAHHFIHRLVGYPTQNGEKEGILCRELCSLQVGLRLHLQKLLSFVDGCCLSFVVVFVVVVEDSGYIFLSCSGYFNASGVN